MPSTFLILVALLTGVPQSPPEAPRIISVRKIWDEAPHNAFTDLIRFRERWYCVFREGQGHVSPDGALRVIASADARTWETVARLTAPNADLRDAKITITPDGRLMLLGAGAMHRPSPVRHQTFAWLSDPEGRRFDAGIPVGEPDFWLWRITWHQGRAYGVGYGTTPENRFVRLYSSLDGVKFETLVPKLFEADYPNETSLVFLPDETCLCLLRRDAGHATGQLGIARPPYTEWRWKDLGVQIGGPHLLRLPDGRLVAGVRLHQPKVRTALGWIDPIQGTFAEFLTLPSGGDTSYPGLVWHNERLWVSYYSSHEGKTSIYLAEVALPGSAPTP